MDDIELLYKKLNSTNYILEIFLQLRIKKFIFLIPLLFFTNLVYADETEISMDWLIEGELDKQSITTKESKIISKYKEHMKDSKSIEPIYDKFITNNQYSIGDYKITINSEEGQILNGVLIEQHDLRQDSFQHKIKYYDRFSDGYVQIVEALLDPIGDRKYLIDGRSLDYNPNSNLELFVLERGYSMDNLESIPNDIFTPKEFTLGRQLMNDAQRSGESVGIDLRKYSPNYLLLNKEQIQEKMINAFSEQTSELFNGIMSGEKPSEILTNTEIVVSPSLSDYENIFDDFKFEKPKFENTRYIRDSLQSNPLQVNSSIQNFKDISLLLFIPVFVALTVFGYLVYKKSLVRKLVPLLQVSTPQIDFRKLTQDMLNNSQSLYENDKRKEAFKVLSQVIRYYYSQNMEIYKEITSLELLCIMRESKSNVYSQVKDWLLLCGSVEYAKYRFNDDDFRNIFSKFSKEVFLR